MVGFAVSCLKEWWSYAQHAFDDPLTVHRAIRKVRTVTDYQAAVTKIFNQK